MSHPCKRFHHLLSVSPASKTVKRQRRGFEVVPNATLESYDDRTFSLNRGFNIIPIVNKQTDCSII